MPNFKSPYVEADEEHPNEDYEDSVHLTFAFGSDLKHFSDRLAHMRVIPDGTKEHLDPPDETSDTSVSWRNVNDGRVPQMPAVDLEMQSAGEWLLDSAICLRGEDPHPTMLLVNNM